MAKKTTDTAAAAEELLSDIPEVAPQIPQQSPENIALAQPPEHPKMRYFQALNSNRKIIADDLIFSFSPYQHIGGTWMGIHATDKPEEIAALDKLIATGKSVVSELSLEEYEECLKKKAGTLTSFGQSLIHFEAASLAHHRSVNHAVPLNSEPQSPPPAAPQVEGIESILLGDSMPPKANN